MMAVENIESDPAVNEPSKVPVGCSNPLNSEQTHENDVHDLPEQSPMEEMSDEKKVDMPFGDKQMLALDPKSPLADNRHAMAVSPDGSGKASEGALDVSFLNAFDGNANPVSPLRSPSQSVSSPISPDAPTEQRHVSENGGSRSSEEVKSPAAACRSTAPTAIAPEDGSTKELDDTSQTPSEFGSLRAMFEGSAKGNSSKGLLFGEAFRQHQRNSMLTDKERQKEARDHLRGFVDSQFSGDRNNGEVDESHLSKSYTFHAPVDDSDVEIVPFKLDYRTVKYRVKTFVVHPQRGMLLLQSEGRSTIPGGSVQDLDFIEAYREGVADTLWLQLGAREGAARNLWELTGIDFRQNHSRLTPAVLYTKPQPDAKYQHLLKNQLEDTLYYFLQVSDKDFPQFTDGSAFIALSRDYSGFAFVKEPVGAEKILRDSDDVGPSSALALVMSHSVPTKATAHDPKESNSEPASTSDQKDVKAEQKALDKSEPVEGVVCCCGLW
eukprot:Nitzschia sp. Nitz4//scaffold2_size372955//12014//13495//NITZ4_000353-RA/size372955-processed-gene-0.464-mRNA-1//-1//CDS//3329546566//5576//frame0